SAVNAPQMGTITAQSGAITLSAAFEVDPASQGQLSGLRVTPDTTLGGRSLQGTVSISNPAAASGAAVQLSASDPAIQPPASVTIPFHETSANFPIATSAVAAQRDLTLPATLNRDPVTAKVVLLPVISLSLDTVSVIGGATAPGAVRLGDPAPPGGAAIPLTSNDPAARVSPFFTI